MGGFTRLLGVIAGVALLSVGTYTVTDHFAAEYCDVFGTCSAPQQAATSLRTERITALTPATAAAQDIPDDYSYPTDSSLNLDAIFKSEGGSAVTLPGTLTPKQFMLYAGALIKTTPNTYDVLPEDGPPDPHALLVASGDSADSMYLALLDDFLTNGGKVSLFTTPEATELQVGYIAPEDNAITPGLPFIGLPFVTAEDQEIASVGLMRDLLSYLFDKTKPAAWVTHDPLVNAVISGLQGRRAIISLMQEEVLGIEQLDTTAARYGFGSDLGTVSTPSVYGRFLAMKNASFGSVDSYATDAADGLGKLTAKQLQYRESARFLSAMNAAMLAQGLRLNAFLYVDVLRGLKDESVDTLLNDSTFLENFSRYRSRIFSEFLKRFTEALDAKITVPMFATAKLTMTKLLEEGCWAQREEYLKSFDDVDRALSEPWQACRLNITTGSDALVRHIRNEDFGQLLQLQGFHISGLNTPVTFNGGELLPKLIAGSINGTSAHSPTTCADRVPNTESDITEIQGLISKDTLILE